MDSVMGTAFILAHCIRMITQVSFMKKPFVCSLPWKCKISICQCSRGDNQYYMPNNRTQRLKSNTLTQEVLMLLLQKSIYTMVKQYSFKSTAQWVQIFRQCANQDFARFSLTQQSFRSSAVQRWKLNHTVYASSLYYNKQASGWMGW